MALAVAVPAACAPAAWVEEPGMPAAPRLADAEVAAMVTTANTGAIELARLAAERAESPAVRQYARDLVRDHERVGADFHTLVETRGIEPHRSQMVRDLEERNRRALESLRAHEGAAFDRAFLDLDIATHEWLISTFEGALIPSVRDRQLRTSLQATHTGLRDHLTHAREVRRGL